VHVLVFYPLLNWWLMFHWIFSKEHKHSSMSYAVSNQQKYSPILNTVSNVHMDTYNLYRVSKQHKCSFILSRHSN